ncbi:MAG: hypothetical protein [Bacteriophage sp.]|nr:MAG: hypothetical protein [Bacteriophage sp.]
MNLTKDQHRLLQRLIVLGGSARTDELGKAVGMKPNEVSNALLPLRHTTGVSTTNDGAAYQLWSLTSGLRNALAALTPCPKPAPDKPYRVLRVNDEGITLFDTKFPSLDSADRFARTNVHKASADTVNYVVTLHKSMRYVAPVAAGVQVEEL